MASWTNQTKNTSTFTNQSVSIPANNLIWNEATMIWDEADFTLDETGTIYTNQTKNSATFINQTKN